MKAVGLRYEEHSNLDGHIPFIISPSICVTQSTVNPDANWHENLEIQYCADGAGCVTLDAEETEFLPGEIIIINTNVIHRTTTNDKIIYHCLIISREFCDEAGIPSATLRFEAKIRSEVMKGYFSELVRIAESTDDACRVAKLRAVVLMMLIEIRLRHLKSISPAFGSAQTDNAVFARTTKTIKYIRSNFSSRLILDDIAKQVAANKYVLSREFKRMTGRTIVEYLNIYRCKVARDLIISGATVAEAAAKCGFDNLSFFTRTFKRHIGILPSKYK